MSGTGCYDLQGFTVRVEGPAVAAFDREYGAFRRPDGAPGPVHLRVEAAPLPTHRFHDPEFHALPDGLQLDHGAPRVRYRAGTPPNALLDLVELAAHWPDRCLVHAASVARDGRGVLLAAPDAAGKTGAILHLLQDGWDLLADDWSLVDRAGRLHPYPKAIHVYDYNLADAPATVPRALGLSRAGRGAHARVASARYRLMTRLPRRGRVLLDFFAGKRTWHLHPQDLGARVAGPAALDRVVWLQRWPEPGFEVQPLEASDLVRRAVSYVHEVRARDLAAYHRLACFGHVPWLDHVRHLHAHMEDVLGGALDHARDVRRLMIPVNARAPEVAAAVRNLL